LQRVLHVSHAPQRVGVEGSHVKHAESERGERAVCAVPCLARASALVRAGVIRATGAGLAIFRWRWVRAVRPELAAVLAVGHVQAGQINECARLARLPGM